jgi:hypothetical protein|tara:strand:- start:227 stop:499 length:273 start_codon:yes stop_codon:yes gene_type:complete
MVSKTILTRLILEDDEFCNRLISVAKKYRSDYLNYKKFVVCPEYSEDFDISFVVNHYDHIVKYWRNGENFNELVGEIVDEEQKKKFLKIN